MNLIKNIAANILERVVENVYRRSNIWSKLSIAAFAAFIGTLSIPLIQRFIDIGLNLMLTKAGYEKQVDGSYYIYASPVIFLCLAIIFALISQRTVQDEKEDIIDTPKIKRNLLKVNKTTISIFCGSILHISNIDVMVTSENDELELGSMNGTSISGRLRKIAAQYNSEGKLINDHLGEFVSQWKRDNHNYGPFSLGTTIIAPPFNASNQGVKNIVLAVTLKKDSAGESQISELSIKKIINDALNLCRDNDYRSVLIPIFGVGSGGIKPTKALTKVLNPLKYILDQEDHDVEVFLGVYKRSHEAALSAQLLKS